MVRRQSRALHTPQNQGERYVELLGGVDAVPVAARRFADAGDLRFAAELASHAVFADPDHPDARASLADILERLGFGAENTAWRNAYLLGAPELRHNIPPNRCITGVSLDVAGGAHLGMGSGQEAPRGGRQHSGHEDGLRVSSFDAPTVLGREALVD